MLPLSIVCLSSFYFSRAYSDLIKGVQCASAMEQSPAANVRLTSRTTLFDPETDGCFQWLRQRHEKTPREERDAEVSQTSASRSKRKPAGVSPDDLLALENDVTACHTFRWLRYAFPSSPYTPLRSNYNNENTDAYPLRIEALRRESSASPQEVIIEEENKRKKSKQTAPTTTGYAAEPSRRILEEVLQKKDLENAQREHPRSPFTSVYPTTQRPFFGGYFAAPQPTDCLRFLLFPQSTHSLFNAGGTVAVTGETLRQRDTTPQPVPSYLRGSARLHYDIAAPQKEKKKKKKREKANPSSASETSAGDIALPPQLELYAAYQRQFPLRPREVEASAGTSQPASWWRRFLPSPTETLGVEVVSNRTRVERRYVPAKRKVERCKLKEEVLAVLVQQRGNPRYTSELRLSQLTAEGSGGSAAREKELAAHAEKEGGPAVVDDTISSITLTDSYDSAVQKLRPQSFFWHSWSAEGAADSTGSGEGKKAAAKKKKESCPTYRVKWTAGPGLEQCNHDDHLTVFAKMSSESWLSFPLPGGFSLKLRNLSALVHPLLSSPFAVEEPAPAAGVDDSTPQPSPCDSQLMEASVKVGPPSLSLAPHAYFWATQTPMWDPKLVRGFDNDYSGLHHAQRWFSLFSVELSHAKKKDKAGRGAMTGLNEVSGTVKDSESESYLSTTTTTSTATPPSSSFLSRTKLVAFANACFVDSFRALPRASVGLTLTSEAPRWTIDAFNKLIPSTFECSFSWFVAFRERELRSGMQLGLPEEMQFMRVSPVETFRHIRCGLTWKL